MPAIRDDDELASWLKEQERTALGAPDTAWAQERKASLDIYLGNPYGDEVEGRSSVVSTDAQDTIEWILPSLMKVFAGSHDVVHYEPEGPEDEEKAKQASDLCNYVFVKDNKGIIVLNSWFKDALMHRYGVVKVWWEETTRVRRKRFVGLDDGAFAALMLEVAVGKLEVETVEETAIETPQEDGSALAVRMRDVVARIEEKRSKVCVEPVPPEEFMVSRGARSLQAARFVGHKTPRTRSELLEEGYDKKLVDQVSGTYDEAEYSDERLTREQATTGENEYPRERDRDAPIWLYDVYAKIDQDGDGIDERRRIVYARGSDNLVILEDEPWEGPVPIAGLTPIIMSHQLFGRSIVDLVADLQRIKTVLLRQILDNVYMTNRPRPIVSDKVDLDSLLKHEVGHPIVMKNGALPAGHIDWQDVPFIANGVFPLIEYLDAVRENRTGVTRYNQGLDADSLNKTARGISQIMSAAQQRIELIARIFAETGVKDLFQVILWFVVTYYDKARVLRLRNQWVEIDPREWSDQMDLTIDVGLGTGNRDQILAHLFTLAGVQEKLVAAQGGLNGPFVTPENIYNLARQIAENAGFKSPEQFFSDPGQQPVASAEQKPDPEIEVKRFEAETDRGYKAGQLKLEAAKLWQEGEREDAKVVDMRSRADQLRRDANLPEREALTQATQMQAQTAQLIMQGIGQLAQAQADSNAATMQALSMIAAAVTAPKEVVFDPTSGRPVGVRTVMPQHGA